MGIKGAQEVLTLRGDGRGALVRRVGNGSPKYDHLADDVLRKDSDLFSTGGPYVFGQAARGFCVSSFRRGW
ncbi:hypothetical protein Ssi02_73800 [Sinosporangium siamense]|uniref:Uncharacterized protein n=1 Tax=Sinosporangium siamense TaxID=1367973 RepID=A0A919RRX1_9ACTN|nr:hypothetical protein Ssi02_73800 [Sinosporangium siamense]